MAEPKLLDMTKETLRRKHYSLRTEESCLRWIREYILFHGKRHPKEMGAPEPRVTHEPPTLTLYVLGGPAASLRLAPSLLRL